MIISLDTIPSGVTPTLDAIRVALNGGPIPEILLTPIHPDDTHTDLTPLPDPAKDIWDQDQGHMEDMTITLEVTTAQDPQISNAPDTAPGCPRENVDPSSKPSNIKPIQ